MAEASTFRGVIDFFNKVGLFDVVLPFLLVFTIVFAILEKTRVFGSEDIGGKSYPKKNLNAMAAFVIAFFVVGSSKLVEFVTQVSSNVIILLMLSVLFLLLIGSFMKENKEGVFLEGGWKTFFMFLMFIGIVVIFLQAMGWLDKFWEYISKGTGGNAVGSIILIVILVLFMVYVVKDNNKAAASK